MNTAASKNEDFLEAEERLAACPVSPWERFRRWLIAALTIALFFVGQSNLQMRDERIAREEAAAAEIAWRDQQIALLSPSPDPGACTHFTTVPYDQALERFCLKRRT
jgi:hypothetical protein